MKDNADTDIDPAIHHLESLKQLSAGIRGYANKRLFVLGIALIEKALRVRSSFSIARWIRKMVRCGAWAYSAFLLVLFLFMRWMGEENITSAFFLYLPPALWFLPGIPLVVLVLIFDRRSLLMLGGVFAVTIYGFIGYRLGHVLEAGDSTRQITVMTYNRGQHMNQSLQPFKAATQPDLLVFQDAPHRADAFLKSPDYSEFAHGGSVGEFTLLSRFPILEKVLLPEQAGLRAMRFARFVVDWQGRPISIYAVHLKTPREVLSSYTRGAFLWGILGVPGTSGATKRKQYQVFWDQQMLDVEQILEAAKNDPYPCLLAGDFNAPSLGQIHQRITSKMTDAHLAAGSGFGFSFPGVTRNPLSLGGPWMRIDYLFHDEHWETTQCITEPDRPSQHRAVVARLRFLGDGGDGDGGE
jgi:endonuclease/exonuclease/phosphatase (EEP) superfamily protein YafD